jgi:hypothetical protein
MTSASSAEPKWAFEKYLKDKVGKRTIFLKVNGKTIHGRDKF